MGLRLSKYDMLYSLGYGKSTRFVENSVEASRKILSRFKLLGLILHSPEGHPEFHSKLEKEFDHLDYLTGRRFLFFSVTKAADGEETKMDKEFMVWMGDSEVKGLVDINNAYETEDEGLSAYTIAQSLGIDYDDLPVIVLTHDLQFNQYQVVKTCSQHLNEQLTEIGYFCSRTRRKFSIADDAKFKEMIRDIDLCGGSSLLKVDDSLAKSLADFLTFFLSDDISDYRINTLLSKYFSKTFELDDPEKIERIKLFIMGCLANMRQIRQMEPLSEIYLDERCEEESKILLNTFNKIYPLYLYQSVSVVNIHSSQKRFLKEKHGNKPITKGKLDYSMLVLALSKIFEIEANLSLVHWIRSYLNIEMPQYFKKHKNDGAEYCITPSFLLIPNNPMPINFNMNFKGKWKAPGIGQSELIMNTLYLENNYPEAITKVDNLLQHWKTLRIFRNKGSHTEFLNKEEFDKVYTSFQWLIQSGKMKEMNDLKMKLKG